MAIRADEQREGYISTKGNLTSIFPFREDGIDLDGVHQILADAGLGLPDYYEWRSRSGCYFCFFQRKAEWVRLHKRHPELFEQAVRIEAKSGYEQTAMQGRMYTWSNGETLPALLQRKDEILAAEEAAKKRQTGSKRLVDILADDEDDDTPCLICHL